MASSKIKGINIKIGADTRGLDTALKSIENKSKSAKNELFEINKSIKSTPDSLTLWRQKQEVLTKAIADSREKVKMLEDAQEEVAKQLKDNKINGEQYRAFQRELENVRSESKRLEGQLSDTNKNINELSNSMEDASKEAEKASDGYTVFKDVLGNLVTQGINLAIEKVKVFTNEIIETGKAFEASMSNVGAISGATSEELEKLSEKAKQMGASTKYTASQAADAFSYMALAGWRTEDMLAGIDGVLSLAAASNMDLALASDIVTDYLTAFGLTAQDSAKFVDQMSYAMSKSNTTTELLGEAYKNCAATAASMGYSVEETTAVLMTMANAGVKGGEAGTALNAIMTRLATDTQSCALKLKAYGVNVYDTQGNMQSLSSILQGVSGVWATLTDQQQANLAKTIAGTNHYSALQTIMNGLSDSVKESGMSFTDYASALKECDGTAQNMADTMINNLVGDMTILDSSIDGVKIALSDKLNPIIRDLVQYITEKMPEIQKSSEKAIDTVVLIAEWCKKNMPEIKKKLGDVLPLITTIGTGFISWKSATTAQTAIKGLIDVVKSLNITMLANPAAAVAASIAALGTAIGLCVVQAKTDVSALQKISEEVDKEFSEKTKRIDDIKEKINDLNSSFYDSASAIDHEFDKTEILKKELDKLVGKNDEVLSANKKRVDYILGELNQALGTEYTMTGNQIENYQELSKEIDKIIEKKQAEALLDAALAKSADLLQEQERLKQEHRTAMADRDNAKSEWDNAKENYKAIKDETGISAAEFVNRYGGYFEKGNKSAKIAYYDKNGNIAHKTITREDYQLADSVERANQEYQKASANETLSREAWNAVSEQTKQLYEALALKESGEYKEAINLILGKSSDFNAETATEDEMLTEYRRQKKNLQDDWKLYRNSQNQSETDNYLYETVANIDLGQKIGTSLVPLDELLDAETISHLQQLANKNFDLSVLTEFGKDLGIDITKFLGNDYSKIFSDQIEKDYNVDDMLEWIGNSEKKIAKESWDDFKTYVYNQIDKNEKYDIIPILKAAKKAGIDVGEVFSREYTKIVQGQIDRGHDPTELINWFSETDEKAAKYFKDNYIDVVQSMIDAGHDPTNVLLKWSETDEELVKDFKTNGIDVIQSMLDNGLNFTELLYGFGLTINELEALWGESFDITNKNFQKKFQETLNTDWDKTSFFEWAKNAGYDLAKVFGENFQSYVNQYLYTQKVDSGETKPNSQWDADLLNGNIDPKLKQSLGKYAVGGYISAGNKGIVAEAGPELLEIMNGGVKITPLNRNSRNTAVSDSTAGQKIFYNTYNLNNPRVSNDMDIRQIAQKLAIEQRRIEKGRGIF